LTIGVDASHLSANDKAMQVLLLRGILPVLYGKLPLGVVSSGVWKQFSL